MKRLVAIIVLAAFMLALAGCSVNRHIVGEGAQHGVTMHKKQWYMLWGLVPLNDASSWTMAAGTPNYTIETKQGIGDIILNMFTMWVTVSSRTVTVTK